MCDRRKFCKVMIWVLVVVIAQPVLCHSVLAFGVALHSLEYSAVPNVHQEHEDRIEIMEKRQVGRTGLMIDTLGLGGAPLGGNFVDLEYGQAVELIQAAMDAGIGYFDTAPWYGFGRSERVMGARRTVARAGRQCS
jgi:hypothetical protein